MRILDNESYEKLDNVTLYFTREEAMQLKSYLNQLLDAPDSQHRHLSSSDYQKEVTICIYEEDQLDGFSPRSIKLIKEDK